MKVLRKVYDVASTVIAVFCILSVLIVGGLQLIGKTPRIIVSGSMEPVIHTGSLAFIDRKVDYEDIKKDDIISFKSSLGKLVVHRAIDLTKEGIETKGDANDVSDGITTTEDNFFGRFWFAIPNLGYLLFAIKTRKGIIIGVAVVVMWFLLDFILDDEKEKCS